MRPSSCDPVLTSYDQVSKTDDGLEAVVFTAQGDMRQVSVVCTQCYALLGTYCGHIALYHVATT